MCFFLLFIFLLFISLSCHYKNIAMSVNVHQCPSMSVNVRVRFDSIPDNGHSGHGLPPAYCGGLYQSAMVRRSPPHEEILADASGLWRSPLNSGGLQRRPLEKFQPIIEKYTFGDNLTCCLKFRSRTYMILKSKLSLFYKKSFIRNLA